MGRFPSIRLKDAQPPSFMVHFPRFPEVPDPFSWVADSQVFCPFSASLDSWWDTSALLLYVLGHAPLSSLNPNLALLHILMIPGFWESPSILVQFFSLVPQWFSPLRTGLSFFFLFFIRPKVCPFMGLGPFLLTFNEFGPCPFLESPNGS